jgi:diaminopimelate decarboxylase
MLRETRGNRLFFDGCDLTEIAEKYGTPLYVMSYNDMMDHINELKKDFIDAYPDTKNRVAYASKAFACTAMYKILG